MNLTGTRNPKITAIGLLLLGLTGCGGPQPLVFPFDPGGRGLNSPFAELTPRMVGRYITFASDRRGSQDVYLYDITQQRLIDLPGLNAIDMLADRPSVSETGRYIAFAGSREGRTSIYLYDRDLRQLRNLTAALRADVRHPTISADGNTIAFEANPRGQWDIMIYTRSGQPLGGIDMEPR
jgi:Tol biopolymer transport system component